MPGRYLLDTNAAIAALEARIPLTEPGEPSEVYLSLIVLGELLFGAFKSERVAENLERARRLAAVCPVIDPSEPTAEIYGRIKLPLQRKGRPIPDNDLWIAATAIEHDLVLITNDDHFRPIEGLVIKAW